MTNESMEHTTPRIFAIGDIHGQLGLLEELMERLPLATGHDILVFMGDYINRGPNSREVIDYLLNLERGALETIFLIGNHERVLLDHARTGDPTLLPLLRTMGVEATLASYGGFLPHAIRDLAFMPKEHQDFLYRLRPYWTHGRYLFVHAGIPPGKTVEECSLEDLTEIRDMFFRNYESEEPIVVFGHTPFETPWVRGNKIGIDTGAAMGQMLTAVELPALRFFHAGPVGTR